MLSKDKKKLELCENCYPYKGKIGNCCITDFWYDIINISLAAFLSVELIIQGKDDGYEVYHSRQKY